MSYLPKSEDRVRVVPQLTFTRNKVHLIAEENIGDIIKGSIVMTCTRAALHGMIEECRVANKPLSVEYGKCKKHGGVR
jgi:hypothetical protein